MKVTLIVSDIGWEQIIEVDENVPVHRLLYEVIDGAVKNDIARATDMYEDLASYGLYYKSIKAKAIDEIPKDQCLRKQLMEEGHQLFVLHRGKKATQHRRRDEDAYRIQYETRNDPKVEEKKQATNRLDEKNQLSSRPKRRLTQITEVAQPKKRVRRQSKPEVNVNDAISFADDQNKMKKRIQKTKTKRMKQIVSRRQKLQAISPSDIQYGNYQKFKFKEFHFHFD